MKHSIYADHAATTPLDPEAFEAMLPFLREDFGNPSSLHSHGRTARKALASARQTIADCIGASPEEVFFTSGGTESINWALKGIAVSHRQRGKHIIISPIEHHAVLNSARAIEQDGYEITYLPVTKQGIILPETFESAMRPDTILASIMLANNEIGTIQDIQTLANIAHCNGTLFHTDAVQAIGHIPVSVENLGVELLSASAHKFNGPKGSGFLFVKNGVTIENFLHGGHQESTLRAGTENIAAIVGMAVALKNNCAEMAENTRKLQKLATDFRECISEKIPTAIFHGDSKHSLPGHISFAIPEVSAESLLHFLDLKGIAVSTGAACNSQKNKISHVLEALCLPEALARNTLRISFGKNNLADVPPIIADAITLCALACPLPRFVGR